MFHLIIDAGNGNTKAALVRGSAVVATTTFPSLLRFTNDSLFVYGGFTLGGVSAVVGEDCVDREDAIVVGEDNQGKIKYLPELIAGVVSSLNNHLPPGSEVSLHLLTLNFDRRAEIEAGVAKLADLSIDGVDKSLKLTLANLLPEGVGCSAYAASHFGKRATNQSQPKVAGSKDASRATQLSVLDLGSGTMNLSTYVVEKPGELPRRTSFRFEGVGVATLVKFTLNNCKLLTTNGQVDKRLVQQAIESNTLKLLDSFDGTCIKEAFAKAVEQWLRLPEVKNLLTKVIFTLQTGGFVSTCGGGWQLQSLREAIETNILANTSEEAATRWVVPEETQVLGVVGYAKVLASANRRLQKKTSEQKNGGKKRAKADKQHSAGSPEPVAGVSSPGSSQLNAINGVGESGAEGVAPGTEHQSHVETTLAEVGG